MRSWRGGGGGGGGREGVLLAVNVLSEVRLHFASGAVDSLV